MRPDLPIAMKPGLPTTMRSDLTTATRPLPAMEAGPRMPQRKYMQRTIWRGELHTKLMERARSMNFCVSTDIRFVVSPTGKKNNACQLMKVAAARVRAISVMTLDFKFSLHLILTLLINICASLQKIDPTPRIYKTKPVLKFMVRYFDFIFKINM
jgi:hypothetical protein